MTFSCTADVQCNRFGFSSITRKCNRISYVITLRMMNAYCLIMGSWGTVGLRYRLRPGHDVIERVDFIINSEENTFFPSPFSEYETFWSQCRLISAKWFINRELDELSSGKIFIQLHIFDLSNILFHFLCGILTRWITHYPHFIIKFIDLHTRC